MKPAVVTLGGAWRAEAEAKARQLALIESLQSQVEQSKQSCAEALKQCSTIVAEKKQLEEQLMTERARAEAAERGLDQALTQCRAKDSEIERLKLEQVEHSRLQHAYRQEFCCHCEFNVNP